MPHLSISHSPVFLLNSCLGQSSAPASRQGPFSRGYGASLPSSLAVSLSSALVCSTRPPVSVCGTGRAAVVLRGFSWEHASLLLGSPRGACRTFPPRLGVRISLDASQPTRLCALFRQRAGVPLLRRPVARGAGCGLFAACPSAWPARPGLRPRLTLIRLALIRNPWSYGGRVSRPPCRYLFPHLPFRSLQRPSRDAFCGAGMLPYRPQKGSHGFGGGLMPVYYPRGPARLVSCYALFK